MRIVHTKKVSRIVAATLIERFQTEVRTMKRVNNPALLAFAMICTALILLAMPR